MRTSLSRRWVVDARGSVLVAAPALSVWGQMRDVEWFLTRDPLHARVKRLDVGGQERGWEGATVEIAHRIMGVGPNRVGRILGWREGRGFAVSDLSRRGPTVGFPHVCTFKLEPVDERSCRLVLGVRGKWTARWIPRWAVVLWLRWVLGATEARLAADLKDFAAWRARRTIER